MAYDIIPTSLNELIKINKDSHELTELYNFIFKKFNINNPFAFDKSNYKNVKVIRALQNDIDLKKFKTSFKLEFGNGSRGKSGVMNSGLLFEREFKEQLDNFINEGESSVSKYKEAVKSIANIIPKGYYLDSVIAEGEKNQKRPLTFTGDKIYTGIKSGDWNIGSTITDLTLVIKNKVVIKNIYLSLKSGSTVTFVNSGITKILKEQEIKKGIISDLKGQALLDLFGIDNVKFCAIFNSYTGKGSGKESVDVTKLLKNSSKFKDFMESVIGFGYISVHKHGNNIHILEMTEKVMKNFISVKSAKILYPKNGSAKRIDIEIVMNSIKIKINIRNKQGKIYPSHIMADYIIDN